MGRLEFVKRCAGVDHVHRASDKRTQTFDVHGTEALVPVVTTERGLQFIFHGK
jgi:hypothetical protein